MKNLTTKNVCILEFGNRTHKWSLNLKKKKKTQKAFISCVLSWIFIKMHNFLFYATLKFRWCHKFFLKYPFLYCLSHIPIRGINYDWLGWKMCWKLLIEFQIQCLGCLEVFPNICDTYFLWKVLWGGVIAILIPHFFRLWTWYCWQFVEWTNRNKK